MEITQMSGYYADINESPLQAKPKLAKSHDSDQN